MHSEKSKKEDLFTYGIYCKIIDNEKHYIVLQAKYKTNAAYWILVIFAAMGLSLSSKEIGVPFDRLLTIIFLSIIGIIGNIMFWYEDILYNERALNINYLEALRLEATYDWLPQVHQHATHPYRTMLSLKNLFYMGCNFIFFFMMGIGFAFYFLKLNIALSFIMPLVCFLVFFVFSKFMLVKTYQNELSNLKEFLND